MDPDTDTEINEVSLDPKAQKAKGEPTEPFIKREAKKTILVEEGPIGESIQVIPEPRDKKAEYYIDGDIGKNTSQGEV